MDEYDQACLAHDAEMGTILDALKDKFGSVPLLETYRQCCIRHQKARDWSKALWWAARGIQLYGDSAAKSEWRNDLEARAASYRARLEKNKD